MATKLGFLPTCNTPTERIVTSDGQMVVKHTCGCTKVYGRYQGVGVRSLLSTTVCDDRVSTCSECGRQTYPHSDCQCE